MLVTFGIQPNCAETGYGYFRFHNPINDCQHPAFHIREFVEKPDLETAERYLESGSYLWNSGMFLMRASVWLKVIGEFNPEILHACELAFAAGEYDGLFFRPDQDSFMSSPSDSIDYAVMERINQSGKYTAAVVPLDTGWSDIGSWDTVWQARNPDDNGNVMMGDVVTAETQDSLIISNHRLVQSYISTHPKQF